MPIRTEKPEDFEPGPGGSVVTQATVPEGLADVGSIPTPGRDFEGRDPFVRIARAHAKKVRREYQKAWDLEFQRIRGLIRAKEIDSDPRLVVAEIDGLVQFFRADFIPFFYCDGEKVIDLLRLVV